MNSSLEAQLATAWDLSMREITGQAERIKELEASLSEEAGSRAKMAIARSAAEVQIARNALAEVEEMLKADEVDRDGIAERLRRVNETLAAMQEAPTVEEAPTPTLGSRLKDGPR